MVAFIRLSIYDEKLVTALQFYAAVRNDELVVSSDDYHPCALWKLDFLESVAAFKVINV